MKKILLSLLLLAGVTACVNEEFDLSKMDTDDIAIGSDESEFKLPVGRITFSLERMNRHTGDNEINLIELFQEARIWLPSELPGGADYVEVARLSYDEGYLREMLDGLFDEIKNNPEKKQAVCALLVEKYREPFVAFLPQEVPQYLCDQILEFPADSAAEVVATLFDLFSGEVTESITQISTAYLSDMDIEDVDYEIAPIDIGDEILEMITKNLDPSTVENPINALYLYGEIHSELPFIFDLAPSLVGTSIQLGTLSIQQGVTPINEIRISADDVETLFGGTTLSMPVSIDRFFPDRELYEEQQVLIDLYMRKTGSLKL